MKKATLLGPIDATFSHQAFEQLAKMHDLPKEVKYVPATNNREVIGLTVKHGGYGVVAMETLAECRVTETFESFIDLLIKFNDDSCPVHIIGGLQLEIHFCLMARPSMARKWIRKVVAHQKSIAPCRRHIKGDNLEVDVNVSSNGEAARLVAQDARYAECAALGPRIAAIKYGLVILDEAYEDQKAITTFYLIGPKAHKVMVGRNNRALLVFQVPHKPGMVVRAQQCFADENLNLCQIHSVGLGERTYHFGLEVEVGEGEISQLNQAIINFRNVTEKRLCFGPFEVL